MVEVSNIKFGYSGSKNLVFDDFSLMLNENCIYGLLGKNGTGKSTLLYLLSGLLRASAGSVKFDGVDVSQRRVSTLRETFLVSEDFELPSISLEGYVGTIAPFYPRFDREALAGCLRDFELPDGNVKLNRLSMGQKKKVLMSIALASGCKLTLMDEPTNGLDIPSKSLFRKVVSRYMREDATLIISTHQVHDIEPLLDHVVIIDQTSLLLDMSVADICDKYSFEYRPTGESLTDVLYAEPSLQGNAVVMRRGEGDPETQMNLELLFDAVVKGKTF